MMENGALLSNCYNLDHPQVKSYVSELVRIATKTWQGKIQLNDTNKYSEADRLRLDSSRASMSLGGAQFGMPRWQSRRPLTGIFV